MWYSGVRAWRLAGVVAVVSLIGGACRDERGTATSSGANITVVDGDGDTVRLAAPARRVISLVPSATDLIVALGSKPLLVGRTRYDRDSALASIASVGGGLDPDLERVAALKPDLVITWWPSKSSELRDRLRAQGIAVYAAPTRDTAAFFAVDAALGALLGRDSAATALATAIRDTLRAVHQAVAARPTPSVLYLIWGDPPMTVGPHTFVGELIGVAGGRDLFDDATTDWPRVSMEAIVQRAPQVIVVAEGEDAQRGAERMRDTPGWRSLAAVRAGRAVSVPADLMERPGPGLGRAARILAQAIHPELQGRKVLLQQPLQQPQ
ncbi:MAG TPA: helical backbone metal receptor [Gemmatimonadaceae bacterium]|nr:helical backbone metal receptor [Gemmatimonadaceae bacterium]